MKEVMEAIDGSIEKWRKIVEEDGEDNGPHNCPLCKMFWWKENVCEGCPVAQFATETYCNNTPYVNLASYSHLRIRDIEDEEERINALYWAKKELEFLRMIKEWYSEKVSTNTENA